MRNLAFESVLERLGRILAAQYNIDVAFEGNQAYTDGKKIVLPYFENMSEEVKNDLTAYLDHEVGHCKFTEFSSMSKVKTRFHKEMLNAIEDVRIERAMIEEFPGAAFNLNPLNEKLRLRIGENWDELNWTIRVILAIRDIMEGRTPRIDDDIVRYIDVVKDAAIALNDCTSTEEVRLKTEEIVKKIIDEREEEKKEEKEDEKSEDKKESEGKSDLKGDDSKKDKSEGSEGEGEGSESESTIERGSSPDSSETLGDKMLKEKVDAKDSEFDKHVTDVHSMMKEEIDAAIKDSDKIAKTKAKDPQAPIWAKEKTSIPVTTLYDKVTDHSNKGSPVNYGKLKKDVLNMVSPIKNQLEQVLKVKENAKWRTERERGHVDARQLARLTATGNRYAFKDYTKTETNNVAIQILVDMSGSMSGRMQTAKKAAIAMAEALKSLDIPFEVTGFYSEPDRNVSAVYNKLPAEARKRFNRVSERLELHVFKSFDAPTLNGIEKLFPASQNPDGECVAWAAKRLADRSEKRKILMVLSDGEPATGDSDRGILCSDLRRRIAQITKSGIECVGVGIQTDSVKNFYPDYIVLSDLKELPRATMSKLSKLLVS